MTTRTHTVVGAITLIAIASASAQFALVRSTQDAGAGALTGSSYALNGTAGQQEAGPEMAGATYSLRGGFWARPSPSAVNGCVADIDNDGDVDLGDFGAFGAAFGSVSSDPNYIPAVDFDGDGDIDLGDFGSLGSEFGRTDCLTGP